MAANCSLSLQSTHQSNSNPPLESLFKALDPKSQVLSRISNPSQSHPDQPHLMTDFFIMERGPRYNDYAELRESRLRMKNMKIQEQPQLESRLTPPKKTLKPTLSRKGSSILTQSVPDFSSALRKENRKPVSTLPSMLELTPPPSKTSKFLGVLPKSGGSKSANSGDNKRVNGGLLARKSYACIDELKNLNSMAAININGENRGRKTGRSVLGNRQY